MSFVLTYTSLVTKIQEIFNRTDNVFLSNIPFWIALGQRRIAHDLKILGLKVSIDGTLTPSNNLIQKPTRWLNNASFNIGVSSQLDPTRRTTRKQILLRDRIFCEIYWPNPEIVGEPKYYADTNYNLWSVYPTPDVAYPYQLFYFQFPVFIDETTSTNFLTESVPELLVNSVCIDAATQIPDLERIPVFTQMYEKSKASLTEEDMKRIYDEFSVR